jgi:hypothetical protein
MRSPGQAIGRSDWSSLRAPRTLYAKRLLERAEHGCLIGNSLRAERRLEVRIAAMELATADG